MGGYGSTRWGWYSKRLTVEECHKLHLSTMRGTIAQGAGFWGTVYWTIGERPAGDITYRVEAQGVRLVYTMTDKSSGSKQDYSYLVGLARTFPHFGGVRYWFVCPLVGCGRRVGVLYLPPGGRYFGCRHCYKLTYESAQEAHKYDGLYRRLGLPRELFRAFERRFD